MKADKLESGAVPSEPLARRLTELERLTSALSEVIKRESLDKWLQKPNPAFGGLKPLEVVERGESDRLWEMIFCTSFCAFRTESEREILATVFIR